MKKKLSFKEYAESKECLRKAIKETPREIVEYEVKKYCNFPIFDDAGKQKIKLKPSNKLFVKWMYEDKKNPRAVDVSFEGTDEDGIEEKPAWNDKKLLKWLLSNTDKQ